ncbi:MAG: hypothetical protein AAFV54_16565, partial [Pseudomonadota bacterium]
FARSVPQASWDLFGERLQTARRILEENRWISEVDPFWYDLAIWISVSLGEQREEPFRALVQEAIAAHPQFLNIYFSAAHGLAPNWGGSIAWVDEFAKLAVENTSDEIGASLYPRIMWSVGNMSDFESLRHPDVDWELMKAGMEDVLREFPSERNTQHFALFSCLRMDAETTAAMLARMEGRPLSEVWGNGDLALRICMGIAGSATR